MRSIGRRRIRSATSDASDLHGHDLGHAVDEQQREGKRGREGLLPDLAVHLDGEQLAEQDEGRKDPELGVERADVGSAHKGETDERGSTRGRYESQVEGEGGRLARHWSASRLGKRSRPGPKRTPLFRAAQNYGTERLELTGRAKRLQKDEQPCQGHRGAVGLRLEGYGSTTELRGHQCLLESRG